MPGCQPNCWPYLWLSLQAMWIKMQRAFSQIARPLACVQPVLQVPGPHIAGASPLILAGQQRCLQGSVWTKSGHAAETFSQGCCMSAQLTSWVEGGKGDLEGASMSWSPWTHSCSLIPYFYSQAASCGLPWSPTLLVHFGRCAPFVHAFAVDRHAVIGHLHKSRKTARASLQSQCMTAGLPQDVRLNGTRP
eukprot:1160854-Pelagomonas_calceolata.AAC.4